MTSFRFYSVETWTEAISNKSQAKLEFSAPSIDKSHQIPQTTSGRGVSGRESRTIRPLGLALLVQGAVPSGHKEITIPTSPIDNPFATIRIMLHIAFVLIGIVYGFADPTFSHAANPGCFDLSKPLKNFPTKALPNPSSEKPEPTAQGETSEGFAWGAVRAQIDRPLKKLLNLLLDVASIKDPKRSEWKLTSLAKGGFLERRRLQMTIKPFPFVSVEWTEEWGFQINQGNEAAPKEALVSYQLTVPHTHLNHLCGTILLKSINEKTTDITLYEEVMGTGQSAESCVTGHLGTIETLKIKP